MRSIQALLLLPLGGSCVNRVGGVPAFLSDGYQKVRRGGMAERERVNSKPINRPAYVD